MKYNITITPDTDASPPEVLRRAQFLAQYAAYYIGRGGLFCDAVFTSSGRVRGRTRSSGRVQVRVTPDEPKLPAAEAEKPFKAPSPEHSILPDTRTVRLELVKPKKSFGLYPEGWK